MMTQFDSTAIKDPLLSLVVEDSKALDRQRIAQVLKDFAFFGKDGDVNFTESFMKLSNNLEKIEMVFLAEKARYLIFKGKEEGLTQRDIVAMDIMPLGSVKSSLKKLADTRRIRKNEADKYYLPGYRLIQILGYYSKK